MGELVLGCIKELWQKLPVWANSIKMEVSHRLVYIFLLYLQLARRSNLKGEY